MSPRGTHTFHKSQQQSGVDFTFLPMPDQDQESITMKRLCPHNFFLVCHKRLFSLALARNQSLPHGVLAAQSAYVAARNG
jgi:hypothetical protein